jgi:glucose-6-phosphate-specific signal transduction histidine kinase
MASPGLAALALRSVAINCGWGLVLGSIFFFTGDGETLRGWLVAVAISTTYSNCIGLPAKLALGSLAPRFRRHRPGVQALLYIGALMPVAAAGCATADLVFVLSGLRSWGAFAEQFAGDLKVTLLISLVVAVSVMSYERLRSRLVDAETRLRDEELSRERALRLAADAQLSSLESRIRPHFLFNALNTVLALIPDDPKRAEAVLERITALLRASLRMDPGGLVALRDELSLVTDYLEIEAVRFEDRLRWTVDVPEALRGVVVPAFAVQTLVENAVKHAASVRRQGTAIRVAARPDGQRVLVDVEDDGPGFANVALPGGHGLDTLRARLAALFGDAATLEIASVSGRTCVTIRLPAESQAAA